MRALQVDKTDEGLRAALLERDTPEPGEGDVLIRVAYSSVNYKDALAVTGQGRIMRRFPLVGGIDGAGTVERSRDQRFAEGDEVLVTGYGLGEDHDGGYADYLCVPGDFVVPLPAGLSLYEAMALGTAGFTAGFALRRLRENHQTPALGPIAVTGATGGVGSFAVDLLAGAGYEVIAVTRKVEGAGDYLRELGAGEVVAPEEFEDDGKPLSSAVLGGVVDNVGGGLLASLVKRVHPYGNVAAIGLAGGVKLETTVLPFILRGVGLLGIHSVECPMVWRREIWSSLAGPDRPERLDTIANRAIGLRDLEDTCAAMIAGEITGRTVVDLER